MFCHICTFMKNILRTNYQTKILYLLYGNNFLFNFRAFWVSITMLMSICIPHLEIMIPLVGVTSGTLCALIYPPIFEMITFWNEWKVSISQNIVLSLIKLFFQCFKSKITKILGTFLKQNEIISSKEHWC